METIKGILVGTCYKKTPTNKLLILDKNGNIIKILNKDTRVHKWNKDNKRIAIITGTFHEGNLGFKPKNLLIYNVDSDEIKIIEGVLNPIDIHWGNLTNNLYILDLRGEVYEYSTKTKNLKTTNYKDINFSHNEKYYLRFPNLLKGIENLEIYNSETNDKVNINFPIELGTPVRWISDNRNFLLFENKEVETEYFEPTSSSLDNEIIVQKVKNRKIVNILYTIFDIDKNNIFKQVKTNGKEVGWYCYKHFLTINRNGNLIIDTFQLNK